MEITDFAMALPDHLFEFIIFEACNMAGIEVAYELSRVPGNRNARPGTPLPACLLLCRGVR